MQTWKNHDIPEKWKPSIESVKKYMPDWKHVLMTDDMNREFVKQHFPDFLNTFDSFEYPIQRADAIRYMWLYVNGGIYLDLDIEILQDLSEIFDQDAEVYVVKSANIGSILTNSLMASKPGAKLWLEMIEAMKTSWGKEFWMVGKHLDVMNTTGPMMLNRVVDQTKTKYHVLSTNNVLPCSVCDLEDGICNPTQAYTKPLEGGSWNSWDSKAFNFILCRWKPILGVIIIIVLIMIIFFLINNVGIGY